MIQTTKNMLADVRFHIIPAALLGALLVLWLAPAASGDTPKVDEDPAGAPYVAGELLITYEEGASSKTQEELPRVVKGEVEAALPAVDTQVIEFPAVKDNSSEEKREETLERKKSELEKDPAVEAVDYNYVREFSYMPNDPRFDAQYGLRKIEAPAAWDRTRGRAGTRIAIVDSGIQARHPDLNAKVVAQYDFGNRDRVAEDNVGHGTHVAGVAAAETGNRTGVAGACPDCSLLVAKIDRGGTIDAAGVIRGIKWSADRGADVINLSLGAEGYVEAEARAVRYARSKGAVVVAAAGNEARNGNPRIYPAAYRGVIAVGATTRADRRASFSSFGNWVDVSAPGIGILSTSPGGYSSLDGTSFSSPFVAGVAGLLASQGRGPVAIERRILSTAKDLGPRGRDPYYGAGRVDAAAAVGAKSSNPRTNQMRPAEADRIWKLVQARGSAIAGEGWPF